MRSLWCNNIKTTLALLTASMALTVASTYSSNLVTFLSYFIHNALSVATTTSNVFLGQDRTGGTAGSSLLNLETNVSNERDVFLSQDKTGTLSLNLKVSYFRNNS